MEKYILKYLYDSTQDEWKRRYYDYLKMHLDNTLWEYGAHMGCNLERTLEHAKNFVIPRETPISAIYGILQRAFERKFLAMRRLRKQAAIQSTTESTTSEQREFKVFCAFHLPWLLPDESIKAMNEQGIDVDFISDISKPWSKSVSRLMHWYSDIQLLPFNELIKDQYINELHEIYNQVRDEFNKTEYEAVLLYNAGTFEAKFFIDVFRDINRISIELLHGLPGSDTLLDEVKRVDYFGVYGDKIRENCLVQGCKKEKIVVVGDCKYAHPISYPTRLRCEMNDVLVITATTSTNCEYGWNYDKFLLKDRSLLISYLYSIENILKGNGITHARLRPHPQVKKDWICRYIDMEFYEIDTLDLSQSIKKASCCIGMHSTVAIEALMYGVSYIIYEPGNGKASLIGVELYPPFDGVDSKWEIANTEEQLNMMIRKCYCPSTDLIKQYIERFKPEVIREILIARRNAAK